MNGKFSELAQQCNAWNIVSEIIEYYTKWSSVKLGLGGVTSVRRNHQKYKTRMEQPRVNWDRGQYDVTLVTFWRQTSRNSDSISVTPASGNSPSLFRFTKLRSSLQFNNNCLCYFTKYFNTKPWHTLHFHVLSQVVSGTNRLLVSVIVGVPIVILNSALQWTFWIKDRWCKWRNKRLTKNNQVVFFIPLKNNNCSMFGYRKLGFSCVLITPSQSSKGTSLLINPDSYRTLSLKITVCWSPTSRPFIILFSCLIVPVESISVNC